jgi:hypothetical protein
MNLADDAFPRRIFFVINFLCGGDANKRIALWYRTMRLCVYVLVGCEVFGKPARAAGGARNQNDFFRDGSPLLI